MESTRFLSGSAGVWLVTTLFPLSVVAQSSLITGQIHNQKGAPVSYANVQVKGTTDGTATGQNGHFQFTIEQTGRVTLLISAVGFSAEERSISLSPRDTIRIHVVLSRTEVELDEAVVTGEMYTTGTDGNTTLEPTEAVTTPGAQGDLFRALHSFPGVTAPGDGAGLYVRGGDLTETKTLLDHAPMAHPYRYESTVQGTFGTVRPFLVDGTHFSMGGFSAKYGNALSGVLAMDTKDRPTHARQYINVGLAAASLSVDQPLIEDELGIRGSGNRSFTGLLLDVNGQREKYATVPQGFDGNLSLIWDYGETDQLKLFSFGRQNRLGVDTTEGSLSGAYSSQSTNQLHSLELDDGKRRLDPRNHNGVEYLLFGKKIWWNVPHSNRRNDHTAG